MPVADVKCVRQANIAKDTSVAVIIFFIGVRSAIVFKCSSVRPLTKFVATAAGDTHKTLIFGPKALANDIVIVSIAAFAAQYAMLLPDPVKADTEDTFMIVAPEVLLSNGTKVRIAAYVPPAFVLTILLNFSGLRDTRSECLMGSV